MKTIAQISAVVILAALLLFGGFLAGSFYARPMAEPMNLQIPAEEEPAPAAASIEAVKPAQKTATCGQSGEMNLLFTGADFSMGEPPHGADAVRLVQVDFDNQEVVVVAFPRDLLVKTPALADLKVSESRLGLAYHQKKEATQGEDHDRIIKATELLAQTLVDNFAFPTKAEDYHYLTLQLDEIGAMIDTIGGVEISLPEAITTDNKITFPAGKQTLDSKLAVEFVRSPEPGGDAARLQRQNLFLKALQEKALNAGLIAKIPELYEQFDAAVVTDLSPEQLNSLACMAETVPDEQIYFYEIGEKDGLVTARDDGALIPKVEKIKTALKDWFGE